MGMSLTGQAQAVAEAFVAARREARALESYPGERPQDLAGAYRIQDSAIAIDGRMIAGWKVGRINSPAAERLGANRLAGPIFAETVVSMSAGELPDMAVFAGGFAAAEAEMVCHVAAGWDGSVPTSDAETRAVLDDLRLGMEIASSPYPGINADGPAVTTSDYGNNAGLVLGASLAGWREIDLCAIPVRTVIDGAVAGEATAATMLDGPYGAVRFLLANLAGRGIDASGGLWVSTGAITGVHSVTPGQHVSAEFAGHGSVQCRIVAASGR
ncbi:MAG: 2-keto-4-pentenoate hydratase [Sphingomonadales bacterium]|nr:2-keto-4-pentenoate hydratase [Sphingomonadales bacterium]